MANDWAGGDRQYPSLTVDHVTRSPGNEPALADVSSQRQQTGFLARDTQDIGKADITTARCSGICRAEGSRDHDPKWDRANQIAADHQRHRKPVIHIHGRTAGKPWGRLKTFVCELL